MIRINGNIRPLRLCDQDLMDEYNGIPKVLNKLINTINKNKEIVLPERFNLQRNEHHLFFVNKLHFLEKRYEDLHNEMKERKFKTSEFFFDFSQLSVDEIHKYCNNWYMTLTEDTTIKIILREKILDDLIKGKKPITYYSQKLPYYDYLNIFNGHSEREKKLPVQPTMIHVDVNFNEFQF